MDNNSTITHAFYFAMLRYIYMYACFLPGSILRQNCCCLTLVLLNKDATPTSNLKPIRLLDPHCCYKFAYLMSNSADRDQLISSEAS